MEKYILDNANVVFPNDVKKCSLLIQDGKIREIDPRFRQAAHINCENKFIIPGFVDTHTHGCGGYDFMDASEKAYHKMCECYLMHGVTTVIPTAVSASTDDLYKFLDFFKYIKDRLKINMPGVHLEGPYISREMCGAQNSRYIHAPTHDEIDDLIDKYGDIISIISAAPEISAQIKYLSKKAKDNNIIMSIGHSSATAQEAEDAFSYGFTNVTHMYCATTSNRKIGQNVYAGIVEAAYLNDSIYIELIGDGKHIPKETMQLAVKIKSAHHIHLVSDSMRAAGTSLRESYLGKKIFENRVIIEDNVAKLPDKSSFAGSIATGDYMFKTAVADYRISITDAVKMLSSTPASMLKLSDVGEIAPGKKADILIFNKDLIIEHTILGGIIL